MHFENPCLHYPENEINLADLLNKVNMRMFYAFYKSFTEILLVQEIF